MIIIYRASFSGSGKGNRILRGRDHHPVPGDGHSRVIVIDDDNDFIEFVMDVDASLSD